MIDTSLFDDMPANARLWVYTVNQPLSSDTEALIDAQLSRFMAAWQSHGRKVQGRFAILENRFILITADIPEADISGCGIDASVHALEEAGKKHNFELLSGLHVLYRDAQGVVQNAARPAFRKLVRSDAVTSDTIVFDTSLTTLAQLRSGGFELPAHASWHAMVFRIPSPSA
ncbi:MAG: hypothetical protein AAF564_12705 [Bacteroidota bacterium]